jgi:hypothetical protein
LNAFRGNFIDAEMVEVFLVFLEYRQRLENDRGSLEILDSIGAPAGIRTPNQQIMRPVEGTGEVGPDKM